MVGTGVSVGRGVSVGNVCVGDSLGCGVIVAVLVWVGMTVTCGGGSVSTGVGSSCAQAVIINANTMVRNKLVSIFFRIILFSFLPEPAEMVVNANDLCEAI